MIHYELINHPRYKFRLTAPVYRDLEAVRTATHPPISPLGARVGEFTAPWAALSGRVLWINEGYAWDGPSGPTVDTVDFLRSSLVHDALYQMIGSGILPARPWRRLADRELYLIAREDGMPAWRAAYVWAAVRVFGKTEARVPE